MAADQTGEASMVVVSERSVRAKVEKRGRWTVLQVELRDLRRDDRDRATRCLEGFAAGLWCKFDKELDERGSAPG